MTNQEFDYATHARFCRVVWCVHDGAVLEESLKEACDGADQLEARILHGVVFTAKGTHQLLEHLTVMAVSVTTLH